MQNSLTVQGIRGLASLCVVTSHSVRAFLPNYLCPADAVDATPHLFQSPFFRLHASGPFMISIFFILSGYVCAIKPIRLSTAGQADEARRVIASSAFRRCLRIGLPATFLTIFAWALAQMGAFTLAPTVELEGNWLERTTPKRVPGFGASIKALITQCVCPIISPADSQFNTWAISDNHYEANLWSLGWEMRGAMVVYLILSISVNCTPLWRRFILLSMTFFYFKSGEFIPPFLFLCGAVLAEVTLLQMAHTNNKALSTDVGSPPRGLRRLVKKYWTGVLFTCSFYLGTQPPESPHRAKYSRVMHEFFQKYIATEGSMSVSSYLADLRRYIQNDRSLRGSRYNPINHVLSRTEKILLKSQARIRRQYFLPPLPSARNLHPSPPGMVLFPTSARAALARCPHRDRRCKRRTRNPNGMQLLRMYIHRGGHVYFMVRDVIDVLSILETSH